MIRVGCFLGIVVLLELLLFTLALSAASNPYGLTQEDQFKQQLPNIVEYWDRMGIQGSFATPDGITISYMKFELENEIGAIVISTGRTESYIKYQEVIYDLGRLGYSVYIHDHRGQGFSDRMLDDKHKGHVVSFDDYVDDLNVFVQTVALSKQHEKLFLLAHSMGGGIATRYIERYPDVFDAAALSSPMHAPDARILISPEGGCWWFRLTDWICKECYAGFSAKPYKPKPFLKNEYTHSKVRYEHLLNTYSKNKAVQLGGPTRRWAGQACGASKKMIEDAGHITIPVLVLQAGKDTAVTPEGQNRFCDALEEKSGKTCSGGKPLLIQDAKHELLIESDQYRNIALNAILDFFKQVGQE